MADAFVSTDPSVQSKIKEMQASAVAQSSNPSGTPPAPAPAMSAQDAANAAKYSTPLPPNDPASLSGARQNPLYIGPTNFGNIQQKYTPYQIEQATTRDASGNIFWKQGVNIDQIPPSPSGSTAFTSPTTKPPIPTSSAVTTTPTMTSAGSASAETQFAQAQSAAAAANLEGINKTIDDLYAKQQAMQTAAKQAAEATVGGLKTQLGAFSTTTAYEDSLARDRELFKVQQNIATLGVIRDKISAATSALDQGILYEESQPVRMQLLVGRSAELKKQGLAQISALTSAAQVVQGNIDLARAYADDSIAAIKADNNEKIGAITTLLSLENANLISLKADEKQTIKDRMSLLQAENDRVTKQKDQVFDLATKYPNAFVKGGVTFEMSRDEALAKMLPQMATDEKQKYDLEIQKAQADIANTKAAAAKKAGGGSGGGTGTSLESDIADYVQYLKDVKGITNEAEVRQNIYSYFGGRAKPTEMASIVDNVLQGGGKPNPADTPMSIQDVVAAGYVDGSGNPKREYVGLTLKEAQQKESTSSATPAENGGRGPGVINWFANLFAGPVKK